MSNGELNAGGNPAVGQHPTQGGVEITPSRFMLQKPG